MSQPPSKGRPRGSKPRSQNIPNIEEALWQRSWGMRNKTHWYMRNLMRNVDYYSVKTEDEPAPDVLLATKEDLAFAKEETKNNKHKRLNPLAGDFPDNSEGEVRSLGKKEKIVDYIRDSHLVNADGTKDPSTLEHANIVGPSNLAEVEHQTRKGQVIYNKIKYQLRNFSDTQIPNQWQTTKHDELMEKIHLERNAMTKSTSDLQQHTKDVLREKYELELGMPRRRTDRELLGKSAIDKMKIRTEEDKNMTEWVKKYSACERECTQSLARLRRCLMELTDVKHIARESQLVRTQKLSEALSYTRSGKLIRLLIRELITLDCADILERVNNNLQVDVSLPMKKDLIDYCRAEMQLFDLDLNLAQLRKHYLGITGSWSGLKEHYALKHGRAGSRAEALTALVDGPTRRAMEANFDSKAAPAIPKPRVPERKLHMRSEIFDLEKQKELLLDRILEFREQFAEKVLRKYVHKKTRPLQPDPDAMAEGLHVLSVLTSEEYAREVFAAYDRGQDAKDFGQRTMGPWLLQQDNLEDIRALNRTRPTMRGNEIKLPYTRAATACAKMSNLRMPGVGPVRWGHRVFD
ncbi:unnamed protein product [Amoebophrya sp. A25]|nr:unnamed protein product [Amoebophrya sp. A25]|eukprot:GSA25T00026021001.1